MTPDVYGQREQTRAKHFILKRYLQALSFKVLRGWDIAYIDGFSGPWQSKTEDFSDTSFMIAIDVLKDAQARVEEATGRRRTIRCFFCENDDAAYEKLLQAVKRHHRVGEFEIHTFFGNFEDAPDMIRRVIGRAFPLIFIDPTGWTGYSFEKIRTIFDFEKCEVIVNFMFDFINRFSSSPDSAIIASLYPILGGPGWKDRLDTSLTSGLAVEKLFRETLKSAGQFTHVVSTRIDKSTSDRPHFFLAYGTKHREGLKAFRATEYDALRLHARNRALAKDRKRQEGTGIVDLFANHQADVSEASIDDVVAGEVKKATEYIKQLIVQHRKLQFTALVDAALETFVLRETNVKDICVALSKEKLILNSWGDGRRKPDDTTVIKHI
jgi:three-Cys-motif partner protein